MCSFSILICIAEEEEEEDSDEVNKSTCKESDLGWITHLSFVIALELERYLMLSEA